jgi:hypothetical protein
MFTRNIAAAGHVIVVLEYTDWQGQDFETMVFLETAAAVADQFCSLYEDKARLLFGIEDFDGKPTGLTTVCNLEQADCSLGVGVAGYSQGAMIGVQAAQLDSRITAFFGIALNSISYFGTGQEAFDTNLEDAYGWAKKKCMWDAENPLPRSHRRFLTGALDKNWEYSGQLTEDQLAEVNRISLKASSGYDCGTDLECFQVDGSGYELIAGGDHLNVFDLARSCAHIDKHYDGMKSSGRIGMEWLTLRATTTGAITFEPSTEPCRPCSSEGRRLGGRRRLLFGGTKILPCCE